MDEETEAQRGQKWQSCTMGKHINKIEILLMWTSMENSKITRWLKQKYLKSRIHI